MGIYRQKQAGVSGWKITKRKHQWERGGLVKLTYRASLIASLVKNPPAMWETPVRFLGREDPLEKG